MIDKETFVATVDARSESLYRIARTMLRRDADCKDALQECVLKAWASRHKLKDERLFSTWLTRILINECRNIQRGQHKYSLAADVPAQASSAAPDPDLQAALDALPLSLRLPLVLHYVEGYSLKEIAGMLRLPVTTIKGRLYTARRDLRMHLAPEHEKEVWPDEA